MIIGERIVLRSKTEEDMWNDYNWHITPELALHDGANLESMTYPQYVEAYGFELNFPSRVWLAIETLDGKHIGNCGLYNVVAKEAELGIMIGDFDYWSKGYGAEIVMLLLNHGFSTLSLGRIYLKTLDWNTGAHRCFKKCGFVDYGRMSRNGYNYTLMDVYH